MRLGHWLAGVLGMGGIVGLGTLLSADDYAFPQQPRYRGEPARTSVPGQYFPRGAAPNAGLPNYHEELFGTPRPSARPAEADIVPASAEVRPEPRRYGEPRRLPVVPAAHATAEAGRDDTRDQFNMLSERERHLGGNDSPPPQAAEPASQEPAARELIPAEFRSHFERGRIRQILAEESADSPFEPPAQLDANIAAERKPLPPEAPLHHVIAPAAAIEEPADEPGAPVVTPAPARAEAESHPLTAAPPTVQTPGVESSAVATPIAQAAVSAEGQFAAVQLHWAKRGELLVGQEGTCELRVKNSGQGTAADVVVEAWFPSTVRLVSASPHPDDSATHLVWRLESLAAGAEQAIEIKLIPSRSGAIEPKALARFTQSAATRFSIDEPRLEVSLRGPNEVTLGDPASQIVLVSNAGTGVARNVTVLAHIPAGLEHASGNELALDIGTLGPGETRRVRLGLAAAKGGRHTIEVEAAGDSGLRHATSSEVIVISPSLKLDLAGPGLRYKGRNATYEITVTNDGTAPSNNVRITHRIPEGFQFVKAGESASFDAAKHTVDWFLDRIEPGKSETLTVELTAIRLGEFVHEVVATSEQGVRAEQQLAATVDGTASLVLEIIDLDDPVEVGVETAYEIRVRNEGSKPAANVGLSCELPQGVELVDAQGPIDHLAQDATIAFGRLPTLEDGKTAIYRIKVRGMVRGHHRFRALLSSDSITRPQTVEELTQFYDE